ncbi:MAG: PPC domain-containing DNA-binding protein [Cyanobacteria bacterium P01_H01_bin.121]
MQVFALRLKPGDDLKRSIKTFVAEKRLEAGFVVTAVGSLQQATLRFANRNQSHRIRRKFEILSLTGTLSIYGVHLHLAIAGTWGRTLGGHLEDGCLIYTTAEIILGSLPNCTFTRELDRHTGYQELVIREQDSQAVWWRERSQPASLPEYSD